MSSQRYSGILNAAETTRGARLRFLDRAAREMIASMTNEEIVNAQENALERQRQERFIEADMELQAELVWPYVERAPITGGCRGGWDGKFRKGPYTS